MQFPAEMLEKPLAGLKEGDWLDRLRLITQEHGTFEQLGPDHFAALVTDKPTLLVTFETIQGIRTLDEDAHPLGWEMVKALGWSHLALVSDGDTWFRDAAIYAYVDRLVDDGFFDEFDRVLFYGAGPCGYAAAAFSVAAPGAAVLLIQPQATLSPEIAGWDDRFLEERRRDFTSRYGYAPDMIDACGECFVIYDPLEPLDSMHAALFDRPHVTRLPVRRMGATIQTRLVEMQLLHRMLAQAGVGKLTRRSFARLMRARRTYLPYLGSLLSRLESDGRRGLALRLCRNVSGRITAPKFARRLRELEDARD